MIPTRPIELTYKACWTLRTEAISKLPASCAIECPEC